MTFWTKIYSNCGLGSRQTKCVCNSGMGYTDLKMDVIQGPLNTMGVDYVADRLMEQCGK